MIRNNQEIWKQIKGFSSYYASNTGKIKTFNWKNKGLERIIKPALDSKGYHRTMLKSDTGKYITIKVHRIIAETFICNEFHKKEVNHKDGNKVNNHIENLEWVTRSENILHAFNIGLCKAKGRSVIDLVSGQVFDSCSEAARKLNIPKSTLQSMLYGYRVNKTNLVYGA